MDAGLSAPPQSAPHRSRAERRAVALRQDAATVAAFTILGQKWVLRIIRALSEKTQRFCELQDALGGANSATLSARLKMLEDQGLVDRRLISSVPPWVEYSLTEKGRDLASALATIDRWATRWAASA
jgi:DNA-binding HxlR family transcriptional regulator